MKKIVFSVIVVLMMFMFVSSSEADVANRLYLVPVERVGSPPQYDGTGPKYFDWALDPDPPGITADRLKVQTYGFHPWILVLARGIDVADHTFLSSMFIQRSRLGRGRVVLVRAQNSLKLCGSVSKIETVPTHNRFLTHLPTLIKLLLPLRVMGIV
jgi:hypothetical protein